MLGDSEGGSSILNPPRLWTLQPKGHHVMASVSAQWEDGFNQIKGQLQELEEEEEEGGDGPLRNTTTMLCTCTSLDVISPLFISI